VRARPATGPTGAIIVGPVSQAERLSVARRPLSAARAGVSSPRSALVSVRVCCCIARGQCLAACRCVGAAGVGARTSGHRPSCRDCCGAGSAGRAPVCRAPAGVCGTRWRWQPSLASPPLVSVRVCCCVSVCCPARSAPLLRTWSFTVPCDQCGHDGSGVSLRCREVSMGAAEVACLCAAVRLAQALSVDRVRYSGWYRAICTCSTYLKCRCSVLQSASAQMWIVIVPSCYRAVV
jgi:hypothetical protein